MKFYPMVASSLFLDINISHENKYTSSLYNKTTYTGLTTKFNTYIPAKYKSSIQIIKELLHIIINILKMNGFPLSFIHKKIKKASNKLVSPRSTPLSVLTDVIFMKVPYIGSLSHNLERKLLRMCTMITMQLLWLLVIKKFSRYNCNAIYARKTSSQLISA